MPYPQPYPSADPAPRPRRFSGVLAPGAPFVNTVPIGEFASVAGCRRVRVRIKTATSGGTLNVHLLDAKGARATTGLTAGATVVAGTEQKHDTELWGEGEVEVVFTPTGNGTITFCDITAIGA